MIAKLSILMQSRRCVVIVADVFCEIYLVIAGAVTDPECKLHVYNCCVFVHLELEDTFRNVFTGLNLEISWNSNDSPEVVPKWKKMYQKDI